MVFKAVDKAVVAEDEDEDLTGIFARYYSKINMKVTRNPLTTKEMEMAKNLPPLITIQEAVVVAATEEAEMVAGLDVVTIGTMNDCCLMPHR